MKTPEKEPVKRMEFKLEDLNLAFIQEHSPELMKEIRQDLLERNNTLEKEVDDYRVKDRIRGREIFINQSLKESTLATKDCTDLFMKQLREADTELEVKQLVADRKSLVARASSSPKSVEQPGGMKESHDANSTEKKDDAVLKSELAGLFS